MPDGRLDARQRRRPGDPVRVAVRRRRRPAAAARRPPQASSAACTQALAAVQAAQDTVAEQQDALQVGADRAGRDPRPGGQGDRARRPRAVARADQGPERGQSQRQPVLAATRRLTASAGSTRAEPRPGRGAGDSVTAARLAQDQADIDTAQARLIQARAEREAATLRAPYAGRILQSDLAKGDLVAASDPAFVLVGSGATTVTTTVTAAQVPSVRRGQQVTSSPRVDHVADRHGERHRPAPGQRAPSRSRSRSSATRPVAEGSTASVAVVTGSAKNAVTVPVSALSTNGARTRSRCSPVAR